MEFGGSEPPESGIRLFADEGSVVSIDRQLRDRELSLR
jgi:hypothetical protein